MSAGFFEDRVIRWATVVVVAHAAVSGVHGLSHFGTGVEAFPTTFHLVFILGVITLAPFVALGLLWASWRLSGAALLAGSMAGSLAFGVFYHYLMPGPDHVSQVPGGTWGLLFRATAALLVVTEAAGCMLGAGALLATARPDRTNRHSRGDCS